MNSSQKQDFHVQISVSGRKYKFYASGDHKLMETASAMVREEMDKYRSESLDEVRALAITSILFAYRLLEFDQNNSSELHELKDEVNALHREISELRKNENSHIEQIAELKTELAKFKEEQEKSINREIALEETINTLRSENTLLKASVKEANKKSSDIKDELEIALLENEELLEKNINLEDEMSSSKDAIFNILKKINLNNINLM